MGLTRAQADALGIGHLYPTDSDRNRIPVIDPPAQSRALEFKVGGKTLGDFKNNKLEWGFWGRLWEAHLAGVYACVDEHCLRVRAIGDASWYTPDFVSLTHGGIRTIWETKGYLREKDKLRFLGAVSRYPEFEWVFVQSIKQCWQCQYATARGIDREIWCPDWLK